MPCAASGSTASRPISAESIDWAPGKSIALSSGTITGRQGVFVISRSGGRPVRVAASGGTPRWSRSGLIAYTGEGMYTVRSDGSGRRLVRRNAFLMAWSPAGDRLLYLTLQGELRVVRPDGSGDTRLTTIHIDATNAVWSPDGHSVAFIDCRVPGSDACAHATSWDVYTLRLDGLGRRKRVTRSPLAVNCVSWAPGRRIAFEGERGTYVGNRLLIRGGGCPAWSPDGRRLAAGTENSVIVVHGDGSSRHRAVTLHGRPSGPSDPAWSPDGRRLAFGVPFGRGPVYHLYTALASGGGLKRLT